ncbi:MAG TPA: c-type cytochrome biogenesis protein CcmI [Gemmatimonadaceae bacterium]
MIALLLGTLIAVGALAFVLAPLFREEHAAPAEPAFRRAARTADEDGESAVEVLREIEFDRATGKLSDEDYAELKADYTRRALAAMRAGDAARASGAPTRVPAAASLEDEVEARIRRHRAAVRGCASCGPRPEPDAIYCSSCGRYLAGTCGRCGADVTEPGARHCAGCGGRIGAMPAGRAAVA